MAHFRLNARAAIMLTALSLPALLGGCAPLSDAYMPSASTLSVKNGAVVPPDCDKMREDSTFNDGPFNLSSRASLAFGCATLNNLARMVDNPRDLVAPRPYPGQSATTAGAAVQRYYDGKVTPFMTSGSDTYHLHDGSSQNSTPSESNSMNGTRGDNSQ